jgi:large subunit ribosomal protein L9
MEIILLERVGKLGIMGDIVKVRDGFARNFLIPQKKALRATDTNKKVFEERKSAIMARNNELKAEAETKAKKLTGISITLVRQASEDGKLYGSVTARDVVDQLTAQGYEVERKQVELNASVKNTGQYTAHIVLHAEVIVPVTVSVVRNESDIEKAIAAEELLENTPEVEDDAANG